MNARRGQAGWRCVMAATTVVAALLCAAAPAFAEKRVALVIGNDRYANLTSLQKAVNDAETVGDTLAKLGYDVVRGSNLGRQAMIDRIAAFTARLEAGDTAVFFYAGHGVAIANVNYVVPVDAPGAAVEASVRGASISEPDIIAEIQARGARVTVLVLDACRDNPFPRAGTRSVGNTRGLAEKPPARGVFVLYSAGAGQTALDRLDDKDAHRNGVFTRVFVEQLARPGVHLGDLAVDVREKVAELALRSRNALGELQPHEQTPAYYDQTIGGRVFLAGRSIAVEPARPAPQPLAPPAPAFDEAMWGFLKGTTDVAALRRFVTEFPASARRGEAEQRIAALERETADAARRDEERRREQERQRLAVQTPNTPPPTPRPVAPSNDDISKRIDAMVGPPPTLPPPFQTATPTPARASPSVAALPPSPGVVPMPTIRDDISKRIDAMVGPPPAIGPPNFAPPAAAAVAPLRLVRSIKAHHEAGSAVFLPDGRRIATTGADKVVRYWDVTTGALLKTAKVEWGLGKLAVSPDGQRIVMQYSRTWMYDLESLNLLWRKGPGVGCAGDAVAFSPDNRLIAVAQPTSTLQVLDVADGKLVRNLGALDAKSVCQINSAAFSPDGRLLVTGTLRVFEAATGKMLRVLAGADLGNVNNYNDVAFASDSTRVALATQSVVGVWNVETGRTLWTAPQSPRAHTQHVAYSPDDRLIVVARFFVGNRNTMVVHDARTGRVLQTPAVASEIKSLSFSRDGRLLVTAHANGTIEMWQVAEPAVSAR